MNPTNRAGACNSGRPLPPLRGMWFPYARPPWPASGCTAPPSPWTWLFVLGGQVVAIEAHAQPCMHLPCRSYGPDQAVDGVMELGGGQAEALGIRVGSPVRIEALGGPATP